MAKECVPKPSQQDDGSSAGLQQNIPPSELRPADREASSEIDRSGSPLTELSSLTCCRRTDRRALAKMLCCMDRWDNCGTC
jgi:hypothetical protein